MADDSLDRFEDLLLTFEDTWRKVKRERQSSSRSGQECTSIPPSVDDIMAQVNGLGRDDLWVELMKIDLEHRLRNELPIPSQEYQQGLQTLAAELHRDLIQYEFEIRQRFRKRPSEKELQNRFTSSQLADIRDLIPNEDSRGHLGTISTDCDDSIEDEAESVDIALLVQAGTEVNQYRVDRQIGSGAFSIVYSATDTKLGRQVALKFLRPYVSRNAKVRGRMLREAQAVATLRHPNIVAIIETGNFRNHDYIVSRFIEGNDLEDVILERRFEIRDAVQLVHRLALAVHHAHQHGVVHRDIKPANIMLDRGGNPLLLDFGLAQLGDSSIQLTTAGDVVGTPAYMPPEQADGRAWQADPRSDVYSLGVLLFQLASGKLPFEGKTAEVIHKAIHEVPPNPSRFEPKIDRDLQTIILKCLEKEPVDRYQSGEALANDLDLYLAGQPIVARPVGSAGILLKWAKRKPVLAGLSAALLLATAFAFGIGTQLQQVKSERDRARNAEKKARAAETDLQEMLAMEAAAAGRLAMQRGQLDEAVACFDRAIDHGYEDPIELKFQKVSSLVALRKTPAALEVLNQIKQEIDVHGDRQGESLIWMAELALDGHDAFGNPSDLYRQAKQYPLSEVSLNYVNAMLASKSPEALQHFQATLDLDPFHHRARRMLIIMLLSLGRIDQADAEINLATELFPEDIDFKLFKAIVESTNGKLKNAREIVERLKITEQEKEGWLGFCNLMDNIANQLVLNPGAMWYDAGEIRHTATEFTTEYLPLIRKRGWHFPPEIGPALAEVASLITTPVTNFNSQEIIKQWRHVTQTHPEGTLLSLYGERLIAVQNVTRDASQSEFASVSADIIRESVSALEQSSNQPALAKSVHRTNWFGMYGNATSLALIYGVDVDENKRRMIRAAREIDPGDVVNVPGLRGMSVGLIRIEKYSEAEPFVREWIRRTQGEDYDALWHELMCDRWQERWYDVARNCNAALKKFPNQSSLIGLRHTAVNKLKGVVDRQTDPTSESDGQD